ncbi:MAG: rod shape-determining protein MreC [bacterium]|nr:rod shape-determining protein MreC [bacterium]
MRGRIFLIIVILVLVFLFLALLQVLPIFKTVNGFFSFIAAPAGRTINAAVNHLSRNFYLFLNGETILKENNDLKSDLRLLSAQVAGLQALSAENETLKKQLGFIEEKKYPYLMAEVLGRINDEGQMFLIVNKGSQDGVQVNFPVVVDNGVILGKIWKTEEKKSFVLLSFASRSHLAAAFSSQTNTAGLVSGERNLSLKMEMIPKDMVVNQGDLVITSGLEDAVPRGLVIGSISQAVSAQNDLFQSYYLKVLYSPSEIQVVTVLLPYAR